MAPLSPSKNPTGNFYEPLKASSRVASSEGEPASIFGWNDQDAFGPENSPIPEVAATVPITDEHYLPVLTFRFWVLSTLFTALSAAMSQYFYFRYNTLTLNVFAIILGSYPLGVAMGTYLPEKEFGFKTKRKFYGFSINPGPFNVKEQTAIVIAASTALLPAYAMDLLAVQRLYFGPNQDPKIPDPNGMNMGWIGALCLILTTQCLGFGFVGFFRRWLVYPAHMWWPVNLVISNLLHTFHSGESGKTTRQRLVFFKWAVLAVTVYQFFPGFIMPVLQSVAFLCLFSGGPSGSLGNPFAYAPTMSPVDPWPLLSQLGSGLRGGGILSMSFDWSSIGSLSPMYTPLWAQLNYFFANFAFTWLIIPLLFTANFWDASKFPVYSTEAFTVNGTFYNISRVLDPVTYQVDPEKYDAYSPIRLSPFWALSYGCAFAAITAAIAHVLLFHGKEVWTNFHYDIPDVHTKLMKRYKEVPLWAYIALLLSALGLSVFTVENWHEYLQLKWWGVMLTSFIASLLILPIGIIQAISNKQIGLNVVMEFIFGLIQPGNPLGNATFKTYGYMAVSQCLSLISDMKLGHYMKIPPRSLFIAQLYGTLISAVVNYGVFDFLIRNNPQIWYGAHNEPLSDPQWRSTSPRIFYTASLIWGGVGSLRQFGPGSLYSPILWFFLGGALIPIPFYLLYRRFPTAGFQYIHWPIILESVGSTADGTANALLPATLVAFTFQYGLRVYRRYWYDMYNYTLSAALDSGTILAAALIYLGLILPGVSDHYGWNPVHPNPLVWQTPEYCYNSTAV